MDAGFNLRKFATNSQELRTRIEDNERLASKGDGFQLSRNASGGQVVVEVEDVNEGEGRDLLEEHSGKCH